MTMYANEFKSWYPVAQFYNADPRFLQQQESYGGLAGFFSLRQVGNGVNFGFNGRAPDTATTITYKSPMTGALGGPKANSIPLMRNYLEGLSVLTCSSDKEDRYYGIIPKFQDKYSAGTVVQPKAPLSEEQVTSYNISYLYIAGFKTDDSQLINSAPMFGDETNGSDYMVNAWYSGSQDDKDRAAAGAEKGYYGKVDNHGTSGGQFVFSDNSAKLVKGNIQDVFFGPPKTSPLSINSVNPKKSDRVMTID
jgi:hypothetical protein